MNSLNKTEMNSHFVYVTLSDKTQPYNSNVIKLLYVMNLFIQSVQRLLFRNVFTTIVYLVLEVER